MSDVPSETGGQKVPGDKGEQTVTITRIIIAAAILLGVLAFIAWYFVNEHSERIKFITVNALSLLILVVIAIQAVIYRREWRVMQYSLRQTDKVIEAMQGQMKAIEEQVEIMAAQKQYMHLQTRVMTQHTQLMLQSNADTRKLIEQNERAVKAAESNVETVERTSIYANRAYVSAGIHEIYDGFLMYLVIANSGNTPANDVRVSYSCGLRDNPPYTVGEEPEEPIAYDIGFTLQKKVGLIPPKGFQLISTPQGKSLSSEEQQQWKLDKLRFYCWGVIIYEDIFNEWRRTQFCFHQSQGSPKGNSCEHGNRAD